LKVEDDTGHVETRTADQDRHATAGLNVSDERARVRLVVGDARLVGDIKHVEHVMWHSAPLGKRKFGRSDVHAAIQLHRVGVDDLGRSSCSLERLGDIERKRGLARAGRTDNGDEH